MGKKSTRVESFSDKEEGGAKLDTRVGDAMDVDSTPAPKLDTKKSAADARAERAARRKQRREELASGQSATSSMASTPVPETKTASPAKTEEKPKKKRGSRKSKSAAEETEAPAEPSTAPAPAPAPESSNVPEAEAAPLPFIIDVNPTKHTTAHEDTPNPSASERDTSVAPSTIAPSTVNGDGLNRAARRRLMQIDRHRISIRKELGIPADSDERQDEVETLLAAWIKLFDEKVDARKSKKLARQQSRVKGKGKGKHQGGRNDNVKQKQIKKQKQKGALRRRQEAALETN
ncbi:hypothetical protein K4K58_004541 [Colletotrichum sp. SAR11_239]|nr:hypothetical protein K4K58_004541 [Colletotrichum sp. SAR11_239]